MAVVHIYCRTRRVPVAAIQEYIDRLLESEVA
jgi:hypothetical protein